MKKLKLLLLGILCCGLLACQTVEEPAEDFGLNVDELSLNENLDRWLAAASDRAYVMRYREDCSCVYDSVEVHVGSNGQIVNAFYFDSNGLLVNVPAENRGPLYTVDDFFILIEDAYEDGHNVSVSYDRQLGYPEDLSINGGGVRGERFLFEVTALSLTSI